MNDHICCAGEHELAAETLAKADFDEETLYHAAELLKIFGDATRIKIIYLLCQQELCVCNIAALLGMTQSAISHQLRGLKQARLVKCRQSGKERFYSICDDHVKEIVVCAIEHVME